jgi:hypothetical protein
MKTRKKILKTTLTTFICLLAISCNDKKVANSTLLADTNALVETMVISYELPGDVNVNATEAELALFAWQEFFALNWQSTWKTDKKRTVADSSWNLATGGTQPDLAVWETYIHRTELRPANRKRTRDLSKGLPHYSFIDSVMVNVGPNGIVLDNYWNILDEDSEIGSAFIFAHEKEYEVLYEAKSNLVEYDYVKQNFPTDALLNQASAKGASKGLSYFTSLSKTEMCDSDNTSNGLICLPCANIQGNEGAIEIKLAFRKLDASKGDDASKFITKEVVVFKDNPNGKYIDAEVDTFGLIGMHIIRKTANYPAFIFASWEQVDQRNNDMQTIGLDTVTVNKKQDRDVDPHRLNPVIERVIPESIQAINDLMHDKIKNTNSVSKWQYYQLIGVQGKPLDYKDRTSDNNYFMANYVIESDLKLTNFHGSFAVPFKDTIQNVAFDKKSFNMGGCQGCHGQAQLTFGTDFSFLLDNGAGKPVDKPDTYQTYQEALKTANPVVKSNKLNKLKVYIEKSITNSK